MFDKKYISISQGLILERHARVEFTDFLLCYDPVLPFFISISKGTEFVQFYSIPVERLLPRRFPQISGFIIIYITLAFLFNLSIHIHAYLID